MKPASAAPIISDFIDFVICYSPLAVLFGAGHCRVDLTQIDYVRGIFWDFLPQGKSFLREIFPGNPHLGGDRGARTVSLCPAMYHAV